METDLNSSESAALYSIVTRPLVLAALIAFIKASTVLTFLSTLLTTHLYKVQVQQA